MAPARNLVNLSVVGKDYAARTILDDVTLGIAEGDRIGVVGGNGQGKSTLLELVAGEEYPDRGQVTPVGGLHLAVLDQRDTLDEAMTVREALVGDRAEHEWAGSREFRGVLDGLLGGVGIDRFGQGLETPVRSLSGGERRRTALARVLLDHPDLLLLDEPTNHLDVEAITWLAGHLAQRNGAMLLVTHDRWFLDAVCTQTWEVSERAIHQYDGGYAAYILARAERDRQASAREDRRQQLVRKELAWLRRGPPARTSKPKFRIEAANALIADEPPVRDSTELLRFANSRLGNKVLEAENISYAYGEQTIINDVTWRLGPGDRVALVGTNGSGKSTLLRLLGGEIEPSKGFIQRGETVKLAHLSQQAADLPAGRSVIEAVEEVRRRSTLAGGEELTAGKLVERFGFRGDRARTKVDDLSGGERRRLTLMRLLMAEPNVLLLDEPTNDLDIETLTALEDLLDHWPGTLVIVSHDRYFVERVADNVFALDGVGGIRHLPGGIDQYLTENQAPPPRKSARAESKPTRAAATASANGGSVQGGNSAPGNATNTNGADAIKPGAVLRNARKEIQRLEREIERRSERERELQELMAASSADHSRLTDLTAELETVVSERGTLESEWLEAAGVLEG